MKMRITLALFVTISFGQTISSNASTNTPVMIQPNPQPNASDATAGRVLFLKNCAHCHGASAHGDEGPDLHKLDESDDWIANRIRKGKAGQMTAFAGKLQPAEINAVIVYLRTLN